jgi:hypothetical protein
MDEGAGLDGLYTVLVAEDDDINVRIPGRHDARALNSHVCEFLLWNMLHVTYMARGFLRWLRDILKIFILLGELEAVLIVTPHESSSRSLKCSKKWFPYGGRTSLLSSLQELLS